MSDKPSIEVRYATLDGGLREFDEIVAHDAHVHLEKMGPNTFCLIVETRHERAMFSIGARRAAVDACETERHAINLRSEAQRRRWSQLSAAQRRRRKR